MARTWRLIRREESWFSTMANPLGSPSRSVVLLTGDAWSASLGLRHILSDDAEKPMRFIGNTGGEKDAARLRKHVLQAVELEWRSICPHQGLDEGPSRRIINVNQSVAEVANPQFGVNERKAQRGIEVAV